MGKELVEDMLPVGEPIPWDLCNRQGRVMFRKGFVINTRASRERILSMNLQPAAVAGGQEEDTTRVQSAAASLQAHTVVGPLRKIEQLADRASELFAGICYGPPPELPELRGLIASATRLCNEHTDTCLAAVHFNYGRSYQPLHAIYSLFLTQQVAAMLAYDEVHRAALTGAALTANLGMFEYHDEWASQTVPLTDEQNRVRLQHPERSVERLQALGVTDALWLQAVREHHEFVDGSGYPQGLAGEAVSEGARVIGLVDRYLAWVLPRVGRTPTGSGHALKTIYAESGKYGDHLAQVLIKTIGVYPPGTSVELASGEIAVVVRRAPDDTAHPQVVVVKQQDDRYSAEQPVRDTRDNNYRIIDVYAPLESEVNPALMIKTWH